jgi:ABC-type lipoprotein release transport system permease subunit
MRFQDYSIWVRNEIKESKIFTFLNVVGVWINVCILIIFLSLSLGINEAIIVQSTKDTDLFLLKVFASKGAVLSKDSFSEFYQDKRVLQIAPVIGNYLSLRLNSSNNSTEEKIYVENYISNSKNGIDLRINRLKLVVGEKPVKDGSKGIIISETVFKKLAAKEKNLSQENILNRTFELVAKRQGDQIELFKCTVLGVVEKTEFNGAFAYIDSPLAEKIDDWIQVNNISNRANRGYNRFDLISSDLQELESLRKDIGRKKYETSSVLDKVDGYRQLLFYGNLIVFSIVGISALLSSFNITITLTAYVLKRQKEIGVMKALGATDFQIQNIFLLYAAYLTFAGSILGVIFGVTIVWIIGYILNRSNLLQDFNLFKIDFIYILLTMVLVNFLGILSAVIPAHKAASITPVETMKG